MGKLLNVFYINTEGKELSVQYYCKDKSQARRLFFSEIKDIKEIKKIVEAKEQSEYGKKICNYRSNGK